MHNYKTVDIAQIALLNELHGTGYSNPLGDALNALDKKEKEISKLKRPPTKRMFVKEYLETIGFKRKKLTALLMVLSGGKLVSKIDIYNKLKIKKDATLRSRIRDTRSELNKRNIFKYDVLIIKPSGKRHNPGYILIINTNIQLR